MAFYFEQSLSCTHLSFTDTIASWLKELSNFCSRFEIDFDLYSLTKSSEWQGIMERVVFLENSSFTENNSFEKG
jgi:hypothetical protein